VMGEGVYPFREIVERLGNDKGFDGIPGVAYKKNGEFLKTDFSNSFNLDDFPFPDRNLTKKYRGRYFSEWMKPLASIRTSKGCPFRCNFCVLWKITDGKYFKREPEKIVEELAGIKEEFVFFADDESLVDSKRMIKLAELIKKAGIKKRYYIYGRSDTIAKNQELLKLWKEIGLERIFIGMEFYRDSDLEYIKKSSTIAQNEKAVQMLQGIGVNIYASFIIRPEYTKQDFRDFIKYIRSLELQFASFAVLTPFPKTDFYEQVKDRMITHEYEYFDLIHTLLPTTLPLKEFYSEYLKIFNKAIPPLKGIKLLRKFPLREIPHIINITLKWKKRLKNIYLDYERTGQQ
ncbi:B12-binding domain-containing radical SAM protein, partial [candidate division KSB1 bacterium]